MIKPLYFFFIFLSLFTSRSFAQCNSQDTTIIYAVITQKPCGLAMYNNKIAVTGYNPYVFGAPATVQVWNDHYLFTEGAPAIDSFNLIAPEAAAYDASGNLYVVQTERRDSNIMIYDASLHLIRVIDNSIGLPTQWNNPRGIAFDAANNLYVVSQDATGPAPAHVDSPNTGKLIKITNPLGTATKTVLLTGLNNPKAVAINGGSLYLSEYGANKITRYDLGTMAFAEYVSITQPVDLFTTGCKLYCTAQGTNTIDILNASAISAGIWENISGSDSSYSLSGIALDHAYNLFVSDNKNDQVILYRGNDSFATASSGASYCAYTYPFLHDSIPPSPAIPHLWQSFDTSIATVDTAGNIFGKSAGTDIVTQIIGTDTITYTVNIGACDYSFCLHSSGPLPAYLPTDSIVTINTWRSDDTTIAKVDSTGEVTAVNLGTTVIRHIINSNTMSFPLTVLPVTGSSPGPIYTLADTGIVYDSVIFCASNVIQLLDDSTGGSWSISDPTIADIEEDGTVWPINTGTATVTYTAGNGCYVNTTSFRIIIAGPPDPGTISGLDSLCKGSSTTLSDTFISGGTWSSESNSIATISASGAVTGVANGLTIISYTVFNGCGPSAAVRRIYIDTVLFPGTITGDSAVCAGSSITLTDTVSGGIWSAANADATVADGLVSAGRHFAGDKDTIYYILSNSCGSDTAKYTVYIDSVLNAGNIYGASEFCITGDQSYYDDGDAGTWSVADTTIAVIDNYGNLTPLNSGNTNIFYRVSDACGTNLASFNITIDLILNAGSIAGPTEICLFDNPTYYDYGDGLGGTWSTNDPSVTGIDPSLGVIYPSTIDTTTISYTESNTCGVSVASYTVTIDSIPYAGIISGTTAVCAAATMTLTDTAPLGVWSASNGNATVTGGIVTGIAAGTDTIIYKVTNACSADSAVYIITVNPLPDAGTITGANFVCHGVTTTLSDSVTGGTWTASNTLATLTGSEVTGITPGTDSIKYTVTNVCGTAVAIHIMSVSPLPYAGTITGTATVCQGVSVTLADISPGGIWMASNTNATLTGSVVTGVATGTDTLFYIVTNICGTDSASHIININPRPNAGSISGLNNVCLGDSVTLSDTTTGGTWARSNTNASVSAGTVRGTNAGSVNIFYSVTNSCGTDSAIHTVTINPLPHAGPIVGLSAVCPSNFITLTDTSTGGTWTSSNGNATITTGVVTGINPGNDTIIYKVFNTCGTDSATYRITVSPLPYAGSITGTTTVCQGTSTALTDIVTGGTWISSNAHATVSGNIVTGVSGGSDLIIYAVTNSCGTDSATFSITINPLPDAGTITGLFSVCQGAHITLADTASGGTWISSNARASVSGDVVTGISVGADTIIYAVRNTCWTDSAFYNITVNTIPNAGTISGADTVCPGAFITLTNTVTGGSWISSNGNATTTAGIVTGAFPGNDTIIYRVSNTCGADSATHPIVIDSLPDPGTISGRDTVCEGATIMLTDSIASITGTWTSTDATIASITASGTITGIAAGTDTVHYTITSSCGIFTASMLIHSLPDSTCGALYVTNTMSSGSPGQLEVYPNPASGQFTVNLQEAINEDATITITDLLGKTVFHLKTTTNKPTDIKLAAAAGIYFVKMNTKQGSYMEKIILAK